MIRYRNILLLLIIVSLSGCTTLGSLQRHYERIDYRDGIDRKEARTIAMRSYLKEDPYRNYRVGSATAYDVNEVLKRNLDLFSSDLYEAGKRELKFPDSWYIVFRPKFLSLFCSYYLVVVSKKDGAVLHEHDSNVFGDLVAGVITEFFLPRLISVAAVATYYQDKNEVPESMEILKEYLSHLSDGRVMKDADLAGLTFEKLSPTKLKVDYQYSGPNDFKEIMPGLDKLSAGTYELEIVTQGDKKVMKISGDYNGTMELEGKDMSIIPAQTP